ncbi:MAG: hypothetical protein IT393_03420 [Nitrospirae bacterium]|nr:hypothetical protein [Nitrospirota bacterium]
MKKLSFALCGILLIAALATAYAAEDTIAVPRSGTATERTVKLWKLIGPRILADAKANLSDADYLRHVKPIHAAWKQLQYDTAIDASDEVSLFHTKVWMLIGDLYSDEGIKPDYRKKVRAETQQEIKKRLGILDKMAATLK